ncbi:RNA-directed DNA polymerase, eukaryota, reverse transcriptase zinc-binding domain protein [Tanacetum coccineum]
MGRRFTTPMDIACLTLQHSCSVGSKRTKEDDVLKISTSVFVTNFSKQASAKDLWNACKQYGHMVDAFIPNKRSKAGEGGWSVRKSKGGHWGMKVHDIRFGLDQFWYDHRNDEKVDADNEECEEVFKKDFGESDEEVQGENDVSRVSDTEVEEENPKSKDGVVSSEQNELVKVGQSMGIIWTELLCMKNIEELHGCSQGVDGVFGEFRGGSTGGCSVTCVTDVCFIRCVKLDRFSLSESLLSDVSLILSPFTLDRFLSDNLSLYYYVNSTHDYGPIRFNFFHYWLEWRFENFVNEVWREAPIDNSNAMINMINKLKYLKKKIRVWNGMRQSPKTQKHVLKQELADLEMIIDKGDAYKSLEMVRDTIFWVGFVWHGDMALKQRGDLLGFMRWEVEEDCRCGYQTVTGELDSWFFRCGSRNAEAEQGSVDLNLTTSRKVFEVSGLKLEDKSQLTCVIKVNIHGGSENFTDIVKCQMLFFDCLGAKDISSHDLRQMGRRFTTPMDIACLTLQHSCSVVFVSQVKMATKTQEQPKVVSEEAKIDLFEDDDEFEEFDINRGVVWDGKEEGKEVGQQWEDDWDDDDVNDDFSLQLMRELENNAEKKDLLSVALTAKVKGKGHALSVVYYAGWREFGQDINKNDYFNVRPLYPFDQTEVGGSSRYDDAAGGGGGARNQPKHVSVVKRITNGGLCGIIPSHGDGVEKNSTSAC